MKESDIQAAILAVSAGVKFEQHGETFTWNSDVSMDKLQRKQVDNQIDPGDNFFGINLSDCALTNPQGTQRAMDALRADAVSVVGPTPASGVAYCMVCGGPAPCPTHARATGVMTPIPIMDSIVGLKAANAHLTQRVAALEAEKSRRDILAQNIPPAAGLPTLGAEAWFETAMAYRAEIDDLTRQLAAHALAHAEQMEGLRAKAAKMLLAKNFRIAELESQLAMRVTPATQPTDAQQTAGDVKAAKEPKAFPAGALKTGGSDPRRIGG